MLYTPTSPCAQLAYSELEKEHVVEKTNLHAEWPLYNYVFKNQICVFNQIIHCSLRLSVGSSIFDRTSNHGSGEECRVLKMTCMAISRRENSLREIVCHHAGLSGQTFIQQTSFPSGEMNGNQFR